jgi:hypothetical protein
LTKRDQSTAEVKKLEFYEKKLKSTKNCDNELFFSFTQFFVDPGHGLTKEKKLIENIAYRAKL